MYNVHVSLCTTSFVLDAVQNQSSNAEREDNDTSHNSNVEQNCGNCKCTRNTHTHTEDSGMDVSGCTHTQICIQLARTSVSVTLTCGIMI